MQPLGTTVYLLKRYSPSDSFCTFFFLRVYAVQKPEVNSIKLLTQYTNRQYSKEGVKSALKCVNSSDGLNM